MDEISIRQTGPGDEGILFELIKGLGEYEKLSHEISGSPGLLKEHLFSSNRFAEAILAEFNSIPIGFALFFYNYSTFLTKPGIHLEDLYILPEYRGRGAGKALLKKVESIARERGCGRLEWNVLDWNQPAIDFYKNYGAEILDDWRICRVIL